VSQFMKTLKQRFTQWFNKRHRRKGTLWEERFRSVLVEGGGGPLAMMAAYIDLNPVRANVVADPKDYRWCGYAEAVAGVKMAQEGMQIAAEAQRSASGVNIAKVAKITRKEAAQEYRKLMLTWGQDRGEKADGKPVKRGFDKARAKKELARGGRLGRAELLRCRVRYFTDGAVIGGKAFVNEVFSAMKERFGPNRKDGARRMRGLDAASADEQVFSLRDLKTGVFG
jgi:putative transposase